MCVYYVTPETFQFYFMVMYGTLLIYWETRYFSDWAKEIQCHSCARLEEYGVIQNLAACHGKSLNEMRNSDIPTLD